MSVHSRNVFDGRHAGPAIEDLRNSSVNTLNFQLDGFAGASDQGMVMVERDEYPVEGREMNWQKLAGSRSGTWFVKDEVGTIEKA
jgi:hypothetical protein